MRAKIRIFKQPAKEKAEKERSARSDRGTKKPKHGCFGLFCSRSGEQLGVHTTIYLDYLSGNVAREVGSEEDGHVGHVFCLSAATEGDGFHPLFAHFFRELSGHGRFDESGRDGVGAHTAATHFLCYTFGECDHTGFGSRVVGLSGIAVHADYAGHVDDGTTALTHHNGDASVSEVEGGFEIDVDDGVPLRFCHAEHEAVFRDAGVVDQNIDLTEIFVHLFDEWLLRFRR